MLKYIYKCLNTYIHIYNILKKALRVVRCFIIIISKFNCHNGINSLNEYSNPEIDYI